MEKLFLLPGFRFHPTDVELVMYYLKRKMEGRQFPFEAIPQVDLYSFAPWDLPEMSCLKRKDLVRYFFCSLDRRYAIGQRVRRATNIGLWKATGKDNHIFYDNRPVGIWKTLVFYKGKANHGERTDWTMHEYRLVDKDASIFQDSFVLCKIFKKSGRGPRNGEQYGAPFREEDWDDDDGVNVGEENDSLIRLPCAGTSSSSPRPGAEQNEYKPMVEPFLQQSVTLAAEQNESTISSALESGNGYTPVVEPFFQQSVTLAAEQNESISSALESGNGYTPLVEPFLQQSVTPAVTEQHPSSTEHDDIHKLSLNVAYEDVDTITSNGSGIVQVDSVFPNKITVKDADTCEIFEGLEDITNNAWLNPIVLDFLEHLEDEDVPLQMLSAGEEPFLELKDLQDPMEVEGSFLEIKDLRYPMEASGSENGISDCLFAHHSTPVFGVQTRDSLGGNWECWEPICGSSAISPVNADVGGISLARVSFHDPSSPR